MVGPVSRMVWGDNSIGVALPIPRGPSSAGYSWVRTGQEPGEEEQF